MREREDSANPVTWLTLGEGGILGLCNDLTESVYVSKQFFFFSARGVEIEFK